MFRVDDKPVLKYTRSRFSPRVVQACMFKTFNRMSKGTIQSIIITAVRKKWNHCRLRIFWTSRIIVFRLWLSDITVILLLRSEHLWRYCYSLKFNIDIKCGHLISFEDCLIRQFNIFSQTAGYDNSWYWIGWLMIEPVIHNKKFNTQLILTKFIAVF